jgi:hypothetical protein
LDCHILQLRAHHKAEVKKKKKGQFQTYVFGDSEHGVNGQFDL